MYKLSNLTIVLPSYNCDRNCPFCIAKNNRKFNSNEKMSFSKLAEIFKQLRENNIRFERIVLSGNGEPSLYRLEELQELAKIIKENEDLFDILRIHTSGNIFFEKDKFDLFNELVPNVEFDTLRLAIDPEKDMQALEYARDYMQTEEFKKAKKVKFDLGLTRVLEKETLPVDLEKLLLDNPNVEVIRFKSLMSGENDNSKQAQWVKNNRISKTEFIELTKRILSFFGCKSLDLLTSKTGRRIAFENTGNYPKDVVFSNGLIRDYSEQPVSIDKLKEMSLRVDNTKALRYDDVDRGED